MEKKSEEKSLRRSTKKINILNEEVVDDVSMTGVEPGMTEIERKELINGVCYGWRCINDVAAEVWGSIHSTLLNGDLVFAYKSPKEQDKLKQIVIVRNFDLYDAPSPGLPPQKVYKSYGVGYITSSYTALLPNVPYEYISGEIVDYLKEWKVDKTIINTYEAIVEELGK